MTLRSASILTKFAGSAVGLLLVIYGAITLWVDRPGGAMDETRQHFCELVLCGQGFGDSPTSITAPTDKPLSRARAELVSNPASAYRWADLAEAEVNANDVNSGQFCVRQALGSAPGNPAILFRAASLYLRLEDYAEALRNLRAVLRNPELSDYYNRVFALYSEMDLPLDSLLNEGLPRTPQAANAFLRFWVDQNKPEEAEATWQWINHNSLTSVQSEGSYVALLGKKSRWDEAMQAWNDYTARLDTSYNRTNWVYNGSFEMNPVDSPFDWHFAPSATAEVGRDNVQLYKGNESLRVHYSGAPKQAESQAYQTVLLKPGKWTIKAAIKTEGLNGEQGVVIRVVDAEDPARLNAATNIFQGTQEWTGVSQAFEVTDKTRLARVEIIRQVNPDSNVKLTGTVWVDAVQLAPAL